MKRSVIHILVLLAMLAIFLPSNGLCDTGTYVIEDYTVTLTPRSNGYVEIDYYQKWRVTGGNIPWITVGLPNSGYSIDYNKTGKNISRIQPDNSRDWTGVHISLDKKYKSGETFEVNFSVTQNGLFYANGEMYRLYFLPGWYDRAKINRMAVTLDFFAGLENVSSKPLPDRRENQTFVWERYSLKNGARFPVTIDFPKSYFPGRIYLANKKTSSKEKAGSSLIFIALFIVILIVIAIFLAWYGSDNNGYGSGGRISTGGTTGLHGRGGCVVSCACACVSCACACACAGGGAAGCDRKITLTCALCKECKLDDCPVRNMKVTMS